MFVLVRKSRRELDLTIPPSPRRGGARTDRGDIFVATFEEINFEDNVTVERLTYAHLRVTASSRSPELRISRLPSLPRRLVPASSSLRRRYDARDVPRAPSRIPRGEHSRFITYSRANPTIGADFQ